MSRAGTLERLHLLVVFRRECEVGEGSLVEQGFVSVSGATELTLLGHVLLRKGEPAGAERALLGEKGANARGVRGAVLGVVLRRVLGA